MQGGDGKFPRGGINMAHNLASEEKGDKDDARLLSSYRREGILACNASILGIQET